MNPENAEKPPRPSLEGTAGAMRPILALLCAACVILNVVVWVLVHRVGEADEKIHLLSWRRSQDICSIRYAQQIADLTAQLVDGKILWSDFREQWEGYGREHRRNCLQRAS